MLINGLGNLRSVFSNIEIYPESLDSVVVNNSVPVCVVVNIGACSPTQSVVCLRRGE